MTTGNTTTSNVTSLDDGTSHYLHIRARDIAGNWGTTATFGPFYIDVYSPVLNGGTVSPSSGYQSTSYAFSVAYSHPQGLPPASVEVSIDGGAVDQYDSGLGSERQLHSSSDILLDDDWRRLRRR